jgi:hypothetical protein
MTYIKPTVRQRLALKEMVENGGQVVKAMIKVGYSKNTAHTPQKLTDSKGFQQLCDEIGLTDDFLVNALVNDIKEKPKNRKPELELAFKVKGRLKDNPDLPPQNNIFIFNDDQLRQIAARTINGDTTSPQELN